MRHKCYQIDDFISPLAFLLEKVNLDKNMETLQEKEFIKHPL